MKFIIIFFILIISILLNFFLYNELTRIYSNGLRIQLDPDGSAIYSAENKRLKSAPHTSKQKLIMFGDSRILMWEPLPILDNTNIISRGRHGETTGMALLRLHKDVIDLNPDIVIIQTGINDLKTISIFPEDREKIINSTKNNIHNIILTLKNANARIILLTIFPHGKIGWPRKLVWSKEIGDGVRSVNDYIKTLSNKNVTVLDLDVIFRQNKTMNPLYELDALHINKKGYMALNSYIKKYIQNNNAK